MNMEAIPPLIALIKELRDQAIKIGLTWKGCVTKMTAKRSEDS